MGVRSLLGGVQGPHGFWFTGHHLAIVLSSLPGLETANIPKCHRHLVRNGLLNFSPSHGEDGITYDFTSDTPHILS